MEESGLEDKMIKMIINEYPENDYPLSEYAQNEL